MKNFYLFIVLTIFPLLAYAQEPALNNQGVCILVAGNGMQLNVFGNVRQDSPNLPGVNNRLGGEQGTVLNITGDITNIEDGAPLFKDGNLMTVSLTGGDQVLQGPFLDSHTGFLNFYNLVLAGTGIKGVIGSMQFSNEFRWETNVDFLTIGNGVFAIDDNNFGQGTDPRFINETVDARYRDQGADFLPAIGRLNFDLTATPGYFDELRNLGGSGFYFRQNDITDFTLNRFHDTLEIVTGLEALPLRYEMTSGVETPADVGINYTLTGLSGINPNDLTIWYESGSEWINLGADEVTADYVIKQNIDWAELPNPATFVTAPCPAPIVALNVPEQSALCQFQANILEVDDPDGNFTYLWSTGETTRSVVITPTDLTPLDYSVTITDATKCFRTFDVPLTVLPTPGVDIDPTLSTADTFTLCQDASLTLDPTVVFTDMDNPDAGYLAEYFWSTGETTQTISLTGDGSGLVDTITLSVRVTNFAGSAAGCERTDTLYLRNEILPGFDLGPDQNFCDGTTSTTLTTGIADPTGLSIIWTRPDATTFMGPELNATQTGLYTVTVNNGECSVMGSVTVNFSNLTGVGMAVGPDCHPDNFDPGASQSGTLEISLSGGIAPFSWFVPELGLNNQSGSPDFTISSTFPEPEIEANTDYTVEIIDGAGCSITLGPLQFAPPQALAITPTIADDECGSGDGSISLTTVGGTAPYTYTWSNGTEGENVAAITGLTTGEFAVTVTDVNFCQQVFSGLSVGGSSTGAALNLSASFETINCPGETTLVTLAATGGNGGYEYSTDGIDFTDVTEYELATGNYTFVVRDAAGCEESRVVVLNDGIGPEVPSVTILSPLQCFGDVTDVSLNVDPQQQQAEYSLDNIDYTFDPFFTALGAGDYRLYARNGAGCIDSLDFTIDGPEELLLDAATTITDDFCGLGEGAINLVVTGGTGLLSYAWDTPAGDTDCCPQGLFVGTYNVTITDENDCTFISEFTVGGAAGALLVTNEQGSDPTCSNVSDGNITITLTGGTAPYRYELNGNPTQAIVGNQLNISGLGDGDYNFTLLDANNCSVTTSFTLTAPPEIELALADVQPSGCSNEAVGSITLTVGGPDELSFLWDDGPTTLNRTGLVAGNYTVTVFRTEFPDCSESLTITVEQLDAPQLSFTVSPDDCLEGTGSIAVSATGGTGLLAYDWLDGTTGANRTDLSAGDYTVTVTDENACTDVATITVVGPDAPLSLSSTVTNISCFGAGDGSISALASGGNGGYAYSWSTGTDGTEITDLEPGDYGLTVSDATGCTFEQTFTVTSPEELTATAQITDVAVTGTATGVINLTVSGGTMPYDYFWDVAGEPLSETEDLVDVPAGIYNLIVVDANGCLYEQTYVVNEPNELEISITELTSLSCFGDDNGRLLANVSGGNGNLNLLWTLNGEEIGTTPNIGNLVAGTYLLSVNDGQGNSSAVTYTLEQPDELVISSSQTNPSCADLEDGSINLTVSGGTGAYEYEWADGSTEAERTFLPPGTYTPTVTDANGCTVSTAPITITAPAALALMATVEPISAPGATDGSIDLTVSGGTPSYIYLWNTDAETEDLVNLEPGDYSVTVMDVNACSGTATFTVPGSSQLVVEETTTDESCPGANDGTILLTVAGGDGDYTFTWADGDFGVERTDLAPGEYSVTISDPATTDFTAIYTIAAAEAVVFDLTVIDIDCAGNANGSITWTSGTNTETLNNLAAGMYSLTITDDRSCQVVIDTVITEPEPLQLSASSTPVSTEGGNDGAIDLMVSGGTEPYTFAWAPGGEDSEDLDNLSAGTYSVTVTDARFCSDEITVTVDEPSTILLSGIVTNVRCNGEANGAINLTAGGGQGFLSFAWLDGPTTEDRSGLVAGLYRVVVTDLTGVSDSIDFTVSEPDPMLADEVLVNPSCVSAADGSVTLAPTGGNGNYSYVWLDGSTNNSRTNLPAGVYAVTITDEAGCQLEQSFDLTDPQPLTVAAVLDQPGCAPGETGTIDLTVLGGTPDYTFAWSSGQISEDLANIAADTYNVTITDANGCTLDTTFTLTPAGDLSLTATVSDVRCSGEATGEITVVITPDEGDLTYTWSNGQTDAMATGLIAGNYGVTVTSAAGCSIDSVFTITAPEALVANVNTTAAGCSPDQGGGALAIPSGGTPGYSYAWSTNANTAMIDNLTAGDYTVTVTDENNCTTTATASIMEADADLEVQFLAATPVDANEPIQFVDVSFPAPQAWLWEFNDPSASTSNEPNPIFAYPNNEDEDLVIYPAALMANSLFCEDQLIKDITVISLDGLAAPDRPDQAQPVYANLEDIALYPNPTPDWAEITVTLNLEADITISLVEAGGRVLTSDELSGSDRYDWVIDVRKLPAGIYFVRVETAFGVSTRKLVVD